MLPSLGSWPIRIGPEFPGLSILLANKLWE
jgi:hypothetical protein